MFAGPSSKLVTCDFEDDLCGWNTVGCGSVSSAYRWIRGDDFSGTPDRTSGPINDHTYNGHGQRLGHFVFAASHDLNSTVTSEDSACFVSQPFSTSSTTEFSFWYYMNGRNSGSLSVELLDRVKKTQEIWQTSGPHKAGWHWDTVGIPAGLHHKLQFKSTIRFRHGADVAIDDIVLGIQKPVSRFTQTIPSTKKRTTQKSPFYTQTIKDAEVTTISTTQTTTESQTCTNDVTGLPGCDFDTFWCGIRHDIWVDSSGLEWVRGHQVPTSRGGQGGTQNTLPQPRMGSFVYLDTYNKNVPNGSKAAFEGHIRNENVTAVCVEFLYATDGAVPPTIAVYNEMTGRGHRFIDLIGEVNDNSQGHWRKVKFESCVQKNSFISFQGQMLSNLSLMAIDDVKISRSTLQCEGSTNKVRTTTRSTTERESAPPAMFYLGCDFNTDFCDFHDKRNNPVSDWKRTDKLTVPGGFQSIVHNGNGSFIVMGNETHTERAYLYANISTTTSTSARVEFDYINLGGHFIRLHLYEIPGRSTKPHRLARWEFQQYTKWQKITTNVNISVSNGLYSQIIFSGQTPSDSWLALDNIKIFGAPCPNSAISQVTASFFNITTSKHINIHDNTSNVHDYIPTITPNTTKNTLNHITNKHSALPPAPQTTTHLNTPLSQATTHLMTLLPQTTTHLNTPLPQVTTHSRTLLPLVTTHSTMLLPQATTHSTTHLTQVTTHSTRLQETGKTLTKTSPTVKSTPTVDQSPSQRQSTNATLQVDISTNSNSENSGIQTSSTKVSFQDTTGMSSVKNQVKDVHYVPAVVTNSDAHITDSTWTRISMPLKVNRAGSTQTTKTRQKVHCGFHDNNLCGWTMNDTAGQLQWLVKHGNQSSQDKDTKDFLSFAAKNESGRQTSIGKLVLPVVPSNHSCLKIVYRALQHASFNVCVGSTLVAKSTSNQTSMQWIRSQTTIHMLESSNQVVIEMRINNDNTSLLDLAEVIFTQGTCELQTTETNTASYSESSSSSGTTSTPTTTEKDDVDGDQHSISQTQKTAIIAGACVGGILLVIVIIVSVALIVRKRAAVGTTIQVNNIVSEGKGHPEALEISGNKRDVQKIPVMSYEASI